MSSRADRDKLSAHALAFVDASLAANSRRAYASQWALWQAYTVEQGIRACPACPHEVANWLALRAVEGRPSGRRSTAVNTGHGVSVLKGAIAAIKHHHAEQGLVFDSRHPAVQLVLRGIRRLDLTAFQAPPLRADDIDRILSQLGDLPKDVRDGALLGVGHAFGLRRSELVGLDYDLRGTGAGVLRRVGSEFDIELAHSKTGTFSSELGQRPSVLLTERIVSVIQRWLLLAAVDRGCPVFTRISATGRISTERITGRTVARIVDTHSRSVGLLASAHSLRTGFAVTAIEQGAHLIHVQHGLRQRSPLMAAYYARQARHKRE